MLNYAGPIQGRAEPEAWDREIAEAERRGEREIAEAERRGERETAEAERRAAAEHTRGWRGVRALVFWVVVVTLILVSVKKYQEHVTLQ